MRVPHVLLVAAALAWGAALLLPALAAGGAELDGLDVLRRGWEGASRGVVAWYANPLFFAAAAAGLAGLRRTAVALAAVALLLAASSFATNEIAALTGAAVPDVALRSGYYVWCAAQIALLAWAVIRARAVRTQGVRAPVRARDDSN